MSNMVDTMNRNDKTKQKTPTYNISSRINKSEEGFIKLKIAIRITVTMDIKKGENQKRGGW
jgi:hypothetical protein